MAWSPQKTKQLAFSAK